MTLDLSACAPGVYFATLTTELGMVEIKKLLIE